MWQRWALPCTLIVPASIALWWFAPRIPIIHTPFRPLAFIPAFISLGILTYAHLARRLTWVQCRPNHLRIQTLFYPLVISYGRIKGVRPIAFAKVFSPSRENAVRQSWLRPYWGKTALVMELSRYPVSKAWLRFWFSPYLLSPDVTGFVFLVEDWMAFSRQLDDSCATWKMRRSERRQERLERRTW
jgi:hypothetical protein